MTKIRILALCILMLPLSNFSMDQEEKFGYTDDDSDTEFNCRGLAFAGWPDTISILNFDSERKVYFYQRLFESDRDDGKPRLKLAVENKDQVRINLGPLKYFALRMMVDNQYVVQYSYRLKGYHPKEDKKVLEDLGRVKYNRKRRVEYHATTETQLASLIEKKSNEREEEWLMDVYVMHFDSAVSKYCYEPLLEEDGHASGVLVLSKDAPEVIDLGPLHYFALRKAFFGRDKLPAQVHEGDEEMRHRWENLHDREEQLGCIQQVMRRGLDGEMEKRDYHSKEFRKTVYVEQDEASHEISYSSNDGDDEDEDEESSSNNSNEY